MPFHIYKEKNDVIHKNLETLSWFLESVVKSGVKNALVQFNSKKKAPKTFLPLS